MIPLFNFTRIAHSYTKKKRRSLRQVIVTQNVLVVNTQFNYFFILLKIHEYQRFKMDENRFNLIYLSRPNVNNTSLSILSSADGYRARNDWSILLISNIVAFT